jgi:hypothetical protein
LDLVDNGQSSKKRKRQRKTKAFLLRKRYPGN